MMNLHTTQQHRVISKSNFLQVTAAIKGTARIVPLSSVWVRLDGDQWPMNSRVHSLDCLLALHGDIKRRRWPLALAARRVSLDTHGYWTLCVPGYLRRMPPPAPLDRPSNFQLISLHPRAAQIQTDIASPSHRHSLFQGQFSRPFREHRLYIPVQFRRRLRVR